MTLLNGIIVVAKPQGITSHQVVEIIRKLFPGQKAGHTGTLDPMATGVLPICIGRATRVAEYVTDLPKRYYAEITLGVSTDTEDATGTVINRRPVPEFDRAEIELLLKEFTGKIEQLPPRYSAVKYRGKPLYHWTRQGEEAPRRIRNVEIYRIALNCCDPFNSPQLALTVECSRGTYIRVLADEIGERLGCGGHLSALDRLGVGPYLIENAYTPEQLQELAEEGRQGETVIGMDSALMQFPGITVSDRLISALRNGLKLNLADPELQEALGSSKTAKMWRVYDKNGLFHALVRCDESSGKRLIRVAKYLAGQ